MAAKLVREVIRLEPQERVLISADPYCGGAMLDAVRQSLLAEDTEKALNQIHPRCVGRGVMQSHTGMARQPAA